MARRAGVSYGGGDAVSTLVEVVIRIIGADTEIRGRVKGDFVTASTPKA